MTEPALERYSGASEGTAALYDFLTEQIENRNVSTQNIPDEVHEEAMYQVVERSQVPQEMFRDKTADQVELLLDQYSHDNAGLARDYLETVKQIDSRVNERNEHDRKIDALIQSYLEDGIEDYDFVFKEIEVEDQDYSPQETEVELTGRRNYDGRPTTDADFWAVDLDAERLLFQEEKSSDSYQERKNRQHQDIRNAVEAVNEELDTDYAVEIQPERGHNLTETRYPVPNVYQGDVHVSEEVDEETEKFEEFEEFVDKFAHKLDYQDLEPLTQITPDYSKAL